MDFALHCLFLTAVERILLEQLGELHLKVDHLTTIIQSLTANRLQDQQQSNNEGNDQVLPISTLEELNSFDERLGQDSDFKKRMVCSVIL